MIRVTESFRVDEQAIQNGLTFAEPGLLVFLDVKQKEGAFFIEPNSTIRIHRPDGTCIDLKAKGVSISGDYVTLFFPKTEKPEVPVSSEIEILPQSGAGP